MRRAWDSNPQPLAGHLISSQFPDSSKDQAHQELRDIATVEVPVLVPSALDAVSGPNHPSDLTRVVATWDHLPRAIKATIIMLVEAVDSRLVPLVAPNSTQCTEPKQIPRSDRPEGLPVVQEWLLGQSSTIEEDHAE